MIVIWQFGKFGTICPIKCLPTLIIVTVILFSQAQGQVQGAVQVSIFGRVSNEDANKLLPHLRKLQRQMDQ